MLVSCMLKCFFHCFSTFSPINVDVDTKSEVKVLNAFIK